MKKVTLFLALLASVAFTSCETELASSVDQDRIYTIYEVYYDRNRDQTSVQAVFRFGNSTGTQLQLDGQSEVRFNNDVLTFNQVLGIYQRQYAGFVNGGTFAYRDANGRTLTNSISGLKTVEFPGNFPTTLGRSNSFTLAWAGEPLGQNERLDVVIHGPSVTDAQTFIQPAAGSTSIILRADMLGRLGVGQGNSALFRYLVFLCSRLPVPGAASRAATNLLTGRLPSNNPQPKNMLAKRLKINTLLFITGLAFAGLLGSCSPSGQEDPAPSGGQGRLIFRLQFDSTQTRLNNLAQPAGVAPGNAAQSPRMQGMSIHYIELAPPNPVALGQGNVLYHAPETTLGGGQAINFDSAKVTANGEQFFALPLSKVKPGTYRHLRVSLAYQAGEITLRHEGVNYAATMASFIGYNTYIRSFRPRSQTVTVNGNRAQGFWALEVAGLLFQGQAPAGATTVPNPLFATSPVPQGSCVVTGAFAQDLVISGREDRDIVVTVSFSTNRSFEWRDPNGNRAFEPALGETLVDMGVRGMVVTY